MPEQKDTAPELMGAHIGPDAQETVLLTAARTGHPTAFGDLLGRHAGRIRRVALRITRNHGDADDVVQECFQSAFAHFNSFRGHSRFSTWLTRIALNCALMKIRTSRHELILPDDSMEALASVKYCHLLSSSLTPEESYSHAELRRILAEEIAGLNPTLRKAVSLCHVEGLTARQAAQVLGISNSALRARIHRARVVLRPRLNRRGIRAASAANDYGMSSRALHQCGGTSGLFMALRHWRDFGN